MPPNYELSHLVHATRPVEATADAEATVDVEATADRERHDLTTAKLQLLSKTVAAAEAAMAAALKAVSTALTCNIAGQAQNNHTTLLNIRCVRLIRCARPISRVRT